MAAKATKEPRQGRLRIAAPWQSFVARLFDPYRPELHYMRGPGPKWRAKHLPQEPQVEAVPAAIAEAAA